VRGRTYVTRGMFRDVPYVSGDSYRPVRVPENRSSVSGVGYKTDWMRLGILAVFAVGALGLIADGATLLLTARCASSPDSRQASAS
jgi:hypothetical protein